MGESKSRGELAEIRTTLAALASAGGSSKAETAVTAKRDVFKKIINYITIGIDMSSLFMQVQARMSHVKLKSPLVHRYSPCDACAGTYMFCVGQTPVSIRARHADTMVVHCR